MGRRLRVGHPGRVIPLPLGFVLAVIALASTTGNLAFPNNHGNSYVDGRQHNVLPLNFESLLRTYDSSNERFALKFVIQSDHPVGTEHIRGIFKIQVKYITFYIL